MMDVPTSINVQGSSQVHYANTALRALTTLCGIAGDVPFPVLRRVAFDGTNMTISALAGGAIVEQRIAAVVCGRCFKINETATAPTL